MLTNHHPIGAPISVPNEVIVYWEGVYQLRKRFFMWSYPSVLLFALGPVLFQLSNMVEETDIAAYKVNGGLAYLVSMSLLLLATGYWIFRKRIVLLRKDIKCRQAEPVYFQLVQKKYYEHTKQYFLGLDCAENMFFETSERLWNQYEVGDQFVMYRGLKSKVVYNPFKQKISLL